MKRVYIAGKLNDLACQYIKNMSLMIKEANKVRRLGYCVLVPCLDIIQGLVDGDFDYEHYAGNNMAWLEVSDAMYVLDNWRTSKGTIAEIERANELKIPVFFMENDGIGALIAYFSAKDKKDAEVAVVKAEEGI